MPVSQLHEILTDIHPFVTAIHIREKQKTARELYQMIEYLSQNIPLSKMIINDRVDVALAAKVAGVQLAFHSLETTIVKTMFPSLKVGRSIHSYHEGEKANRDGSDYVLFGHIFPSSSKPGKTPKGLKQLAKVAQLDIPVIAIGGITPENARSVIHAGAKGIAVMSGILEARDPLSAVKDYYNALINGDGKIDAYI
ncbi:UNVERIFIED_ORG: thiazole tautomerase (transcriptional regulator TenI) [Heyndrickxia coagulans]